MLLMLEQCHGNCGAIILYHFAESTIRRIFTRKTIKDSENNEIAFCKLEICFSIMIILSQMNNNDFKLAATIF